MRFAIPPSSARGPGFAVGTILTLALGIGATTAVFSYLLNAVLLGGLCRFPIHSDSMWVQQADLEPGAPANASEPLSYPDFFDWRARSHSVSGMACYRHDRLTLTGSGAPQMLEASVVSSEFFRVLGVRPLLGRDLLPGDERPGARVAILSYALWQSTFGGARDTLGRTVALNGRNHVIVAIMPAGFVFPIQNPAPALWTTLAGDAEGSTPPWTAAAMEASDSLNVVRPDRVSRGVT